MKSRYAKRAHALGLACSVFVEALEGRTLCYAPVPPSYTPLETVQIRPASATYSAGLTLSAGVTYFLQATGYTRTKANVYHGDTAFIATTATSTTTTTTTSWGITVNAGTTTVDPTGWGTIQTDHIYGQHLTLKTSGALSFSFANDAMDAISTLAVTVYAPVPAVTVATVKHTDSASTQVTVASLPSQQVFLPLDDADWDHNGIADDKQSGAVPGDRFLLPTTLPAIPGATATTHIVIKPPPGVRVWLNPDRTGSTVGVGLRALTARTVYLEGYAEQKGDASADIQILLGSTTQDLPVTVFSLSGPLTATGGSTQVFSSDSQVGEWKTAINGELDTKTITTAKGIAYANVAWDNKTTTGYAVFEADNDYLWGWPVEVTS